MYGEYVYTYGCEWVSWERKELTEDYFLSLTPFSPLSLPPNLLITISRSLKK